MKRYNSTETTAESRKRLNRIVPDITSVLLSIFPSKRDAKLDDARMQALFNALAILFLLVGACIAAAVYYVLQPFLHALLWAILTGTFLHPFKHRCTTQLNAWLLNLEDSNVPLTFGLLLSPLYLFNWASTSLKDLALTHWRALAGSVLGLGGLWVLVAISASAYDGLEVAYGAMTQMDAMLAQTRWLQLYTLVAGLIVLLLTVRRRRFVWRVFFLSLWVCLGINVGSYLLGPVIIPIVAATMLLACSSALYYHVFGEVGDEEEEDTTSSSPSHSLEEGNALRAAGGDVGRSGDTVRGQQGRPEPHVVVHPGSKDTGEGGVEEREGGGGGTNEVVERTGLQTSDSTENVAAIGCDLNLLPSEEEGRRLFPAGHQLHHQAHHHHHLQQAAAVDSVPDNNDTIGGVPPTSTHLGGEEEEERGRVESHGHTDTVDFGGRVHRKASPIGKKHHHGNFIFVVLLSVCTVVVLWLHPFLLYALVPSCAWLVLKYLCSGLMLPRTVACVSSLASVVGTWVDVVVPLPLSSLANLFVSLDRLCAYVVKASLGSLVSVNIIAGLVLAVVCGVLLLGFQMQLEMRHFGSVVLSIWNSTVANHPHLNQSLVIRWSSTTTSDTFNSSLNPFFAESYEYGRTWLASKIQSLVNEHIGNTSLLGEGLLNLYDKFYHSYVLQDTSPPGNRHEVYDKKVLYDNQLLLWSELQTIIRSNWETVLAVWSLVSNNVALIANNIALVASFLTSLLSALLSGGSALLNVFVFFTALYYVLSLSDESYLPTSWVMDFLPLAYSGGDLGEVLSRAIRSVFHASLQRAFFYGMYTWVVHAIFDLPVSVLPAVLAAIVGAVPFVGPYWAALPAVLELWLVEKQLVLSLCLLGLLLLPYFLLDNILYEEVEGAHPYMTGLAVAGGIYFAGLEGAIIGPILLCCLLFVKELYNSLCDQIDQADSPQPHPHPYMAHHHSDYLH